MGARVLLVEDEAITAEHVCLNLAGEGYAADFVVSGEECISRLETDPSYDIVVMDIDLAPGHMTGAEATREIRTRHDLPVVFYTGHTDAQTVVPTRTADAYGCVFKADGDLQVLVSSIEQAVRRWRAEHSMSRRYEALLSLVHGLDLLVYVVDRARRSVLFLNEAAREQLDGRATISNTEIFLIGQLSKLEDDVGPSDTPERKLSRTITDDESLLYHEDSGRWYAVTVSPIVWDTHEDAYLLVSIDVTEVVEDRRRLANELEQSKLRLEEVNHRIKNNLALVQSLVHFSERELPDGYDLADLYHQIRALRVMYQRLDSRDAQGTVNVRTYISEILDGVFHQGEQTGVTVEVDVPPRRMAAKSATPLGLIVSELAINAVKHAFSSGRANHFRVAGREAQDGRSFLIEVADNAGALPEEVNLQSPGSTGLRLVVSLVGQLRGSIGVHRDAETKFELRLPLLHFAD
ncbi:MAG: response regulator [Spirochaetes bacterium]|jgi:two-component sensor histidine kinase/CheY-like chemotaxis protein|nr:response regulator [Spirochaetota bacterium]